MDCSRHEGRQRQRNLNKAVWSVLLISAALSRTGLQYAVLFDESNAEETTDYWFDKSGTEEIGKVSTGNVIQKYSANTSSNVLNVHIVPHTHNDVGWQRTVEQYYFGLNNSIQDTGAGVHAIIDTMVEALLENPSRTFTYVEVKFFSMWWERQNEAVKETIHTLVKDKQLNFANGGWCMHDEATTHFMGMIDQTTLGHSFLKKELGVVPTVGWQLDPFGHSATQASLMTSKAGFDALYFGRIDYQDLELRQLTKECEGLWNSSRSGNYSTVFWGLTGSYGGNYGAPPGSCFDILCQDPSYIVEKNKTELVKSVSDFLRNVRIQSDRTKGNHIMLTMGGDFTFSRSRTHFANLDALIGSVMSFQDWGSVDIPSMFGPRFDRINLFYSSPEYYTQCKFEEAEEAHTSSDGSLLSVKQDDFFPYSDCEHCFWTGYFTSRPGLKRLERVASSFLLAARQLESLIDYTGKSDPFECESGFHELEDAVGVLQHHDGVSGTARQHVANDYAKRVQDGLDRVEMCTVRKLKRAFLGANAFDFLADLSYCQLLNETTCAVSQKATLENNLDLYVIVYNSIASSRSTVVNLPVSSDRTYTISRLDTAGSIQTSRPSLSLPTSLKGGAKFILSFDTGPLPAVGAAVFKIIWSQKILEKYPEPASFPLPIGTTSRRLVGSSTSSKGAEVEVSNGLLSVRFDSLTGAMKGITESGKTLNISQTWGYYTSFDSSLDSSNIDQEHQNSGAYVFRPSTPEQQIHVLQPSKVQFRDVAVGTEVHVEYEGSWVQTTTRILAGRPYIEVEYTVGPIPIDDGRGKELVTRLHTSIENGGDFFTDSNGREFLKRKRNYRPTWDLNVFEPVAGNYYPINSAIYIEDERKRALAVVVDRSQGGSSLEDGTVELMVQRRILADDSRGVHEPLNETVGGITAYPPYGSGVRVGEGVVIRGKHRILVGDQGGAKLARSAMDDMFAEPPIFVSSVPSKHSVPFRVANISAIQKELPANVMLITLSLLYDTPARTFLIRLGHQYSIGEDELLSQSVEVDLGSLLLGYKVVSVVEKTLTGNQNHSSWMARRLNWTPGAAYVPVGPKGTSVGNHRVYLDPMEIRTFHVECGC